MPDVECGRVPLSREIRVARPFSPGSSAGRVRLGAVGSVDPVLTPETARRALLSLPSGIGQAATLHAHTRFLVEALARCLPTTAASCYPGGENDLDL